MSDLLAGQVALVTGGGSGLGRAIALELAACGAQVLVTGRNRATLESTAAACATGRCSVAPADIRDEDAVDGLVETALDRYGRIDVLVNNAGGQFLAPAETVSANGFRAVVRLNLEGTWLMTVAVARRAFIPQRGGKVVNITLSPRSGMPGMAHSGAARAGVENLTRTLAIEWARYNIKLTAIALGTFDTEALDKYPTSVRDAAGSVAPAQRLGRPEECAWATAFLASAAGDFFTGGVLTLDGARDNWTGAWPPPEMIGADGGPLAEVRRNGP